MSVMCSKPSMPGQVDERAEVGQVLDVAGDHVADVDALQERLALGVALGLDEFAAREDDVLAVVVDLDDLEIVGVADELVEVLRRGDVDLAAGQERLDADVDHEAALDDALDLALDEAVAVEHADDLLPVLAVERFFAGEHDHALVVFETFEENVHFVADVHVVEIVEFGKRDDTLRFVADVHEGFARAEFEDMAFDDGAFAEVAHGLRNEFLHSCHNQLGVGQTTRTGGGQKGPATESPGGFRVTVFGWFSLRAARSGRNARERKHSQKNGRGKPMCIINFRGRKERAAKRHENSQKRISRNFSYSAFLCLLCLFAAKVRRSPSHSWQQTKSASAWSGLGIGSWHLKHYQEIPGVKIQALCDQNVDLLEKVRTEYNVPQTFTEFDKFLDAADIDAVTLAVPNFLHRPMTLAALDKGWHVLCEKPMALNAAEAIEMRAKVRETKRKFMIHFNQRFRAEHQYFKALIDSGQAGRDLLRQHGLAADARHPEVRRLVRPEKDERRRTADRPGRPHARPDALAHRQPEGGDGVGQHVLAPGRELARAQSKEFDVEDLATALIRFDNGTSLMLEVNWALNFEEREKVFLELSGKKGGLSNVTFDYKDTTTCIFREENGAMVKTVPLKYPASFETAQGHFIRSIREDFEPSAGASDGVEIMRILDAIYASALDQREVVMENVDFTHPLVETPAVAGAVEASGRDHFPCL